MTCGCFLIGIVSSLALGEWKEVTIAGLNLFDAIDYLTAKIMLPSNGMLIAIFVGWIVDKTIIRDEVTNYGSTKVSYYPIFLFLLRYVSPIGIALIFVNELGLL